MAVQQTDDTVDVGTRQVQRLSQCTHRRFGDVAETCLHVMQDLDQVLRAGAVSGNDVADRVRCLAIRTHATTLSLAE